MKSIQNKIVSKNIKTKIMVFGTFDIVHKGHLDFFKQARSLTKNPYLIVSVAKSLNVKRIKGRGPLNNERKRLEAIKGLAFVDKAVLGATKNFLNHIVKNRPKIIALGYDQSAYTKDLKQKLEKRGLLVQVFRLKSFKPKTYKSSIIKNK